MRRVGALAALVTVAMEAGKLREAVAAETGVRNSGSDRDGGGRS